MRKNWLLLQGILITGVLAAQEPAMDYTFFTNSRMSGYYYYSHASWQAPSLVANRNQRLPVADSVSHTPGNAIQIEFVNGDKGNWKATIFRQEMRGIDRFNPAKYLSFWVYVIGNETTMDDLPAVQIMKGDSTLSAPVAFRPAAMDRWERILIPVENLRGMDLVSVENNIGLVFSQHHNEGGRHVLFIDDIEFCSQNTFPQPGKALPVITKTKGYARHVDIEWAPVTDRNVKWVKIYRSEAGNRFIPVGIQYPGTNRYTDYTGKTGVNYLYAISFVDYNYNETGKSRPDFTSTREMTDEELLDMVQRASFRYYWEGAEKTSGLARENIPGRQNMVASGASGFGIMAMIVGASRHFITRKEAVDRFTQIVNYLDKAANFHGAFPHFIDGPTGKVEPFFGNRDNGGDLVETAFLFQGLLTARAYFDQDNEAEKYIREKITQLWERVDWNWYKQFPDSKFLYWHWSPDQAWVINHRLIGWNETMIAYILAISSPTHGVPASMYYTGWANQESIGQQYRKAWGGTEDGSHYTNGKTYFGVKLDVGVSDGGPLFFTHYSYMGLDPHAVTDKYTNYFTNNRNIAQINYNYCKANPNHFMGYGDSCWGLTASDGPDYYSADEPVAARDIGKVAPTGAIGSFPYTPEASMAALKNYYYNYGQFLWGEYGFRDAFNLSQNWCSEIFMGLNQARMVVMMENYRTGLIWELFLSNKDIQNGLKKLQAETALRK